MKPNHNPVLGAEPMRADGDTRATSLITGGRTAVANAATGAELDEANQPWRWRNCRDIGIRVDVWPLPWSWHLGIYVEGDHLAKSWFLNLGPISIGISANIGNCSLPGWQGKIGLSEDEAWQRAKPR